MLTTPLRLNLVALVVACYLLMNIAVTNPIVRISILHVKQTNQAKPGSVQPVSYVAPPRAQHTHVAVGGLEYLIFSCPLDSNKTRIEISRRASIEIPRA